MSTIMTLVETSTSAKSHWVDQYGRSLCGKINASSRTLVPGEFGKRCSNCVGSMRRMSWVAEVVAYEENATWFTIDLNSPDEVEGVAEAHTRVLSDQVKIAEIQAEYERLCSETDVAVRIRARVLGIAHADEMTIPVLRNHIARRVIEDSYVTDIFVDEVREAVAPLTMRQVVDIAHGFAIEEHLKREAAQNKILIITGGELHDWSYAPPADFMLNLSRMLRDPAHVPSGEPLDKRGDTDLDVYEFVMSTEGAEDLLAATVNLIGNTQNSAPLVIHVKCRGGKHRAPAFGMALHAELSMLGLDGEFGYSTVIYHLHAHLGRVITGENA
jgi:hypothetical protein